MLWVYGIISGLFLLSRLIISYYYKDDHSKVYPRYPSVSFVIACKNEEDSIAKTIDTCLRSDYPGLMECVAVDDGSTDRTLEEMKRCQAFWKEKLKIIPFAKNRGKREAMAEGVLIVSNEIIIFVDSDSFPQPQAARLIVEHFMKDPKVAAVSGNSQVENINYNALTRMQSARYGTSFDIFKAAESVFGTVTCCPGCFSAYRKKAVMKVLDKWRNQMFFGTRSTFGDDRSLTNYILRNNKVVYCRSAVATTIVPEEYKKFFKQQLRWKKSWIREGTNSARFMWRKNPIASASFYCNLMIPLFAPVIAFRAIVVHGIFDQNLPYLLTYIFGLLTMSFLFGVFYYFISNNKYWWYMVPFTIMYTLFLNWQMPYAMFRLKDTRWGTR